MKIGELASLTGASVRSIRHYQAQGLVRVERNANGYRDFGESAVELVRRIRVLLRNGFTLDEIRSVAVDLDDANLGSVCGDVVKLYEAKLAELDARIGEMQTVQRRIRERLHEIERQRARE
jgi:DNA-binding transcriptional MerR regulator